MNGQLGISLKHPSVLNNLFGVCILIALTSCLDVPNPPKPDVSCTPLKAHVWKNSGEERVHLRLEAHLATRYGTFMVRPLRPWAFQLLADTNNLLASPKVQMWSMQQMIAAGAVDNRQYSLKTLPIPVVIDLSNDYDLRLPASKQKGETITFCIRFVYHNHFSDYVPITCQID